MTMLAKKAAMETAAENTRGNGAELSRGTGTEISQGNGAELSRGTGTEIPQGNGAEMGRTLTLADYEARICIYREQAVTGYLGIGKTLNEAKAAGIVPHGEWESWVERTSGLSLRQAQRCMQAASEIKEGSWLGRIDMSKAVMLLSSGLDDETKEELGRKAAEEGASVRDLKEEIRKLKLDKVASAGAAAEMRAELKKMREERDQVAGQLEASMRAYETRMEEISKEAYDRGLGDRGADAEREKAELQEQNQQMREKLTEANLRVKYLERNADALAKKSAAEARQEVVAEARDEIRKEFEGKLSYANSERRHLEDARKDLMRELDGERKKNSARWDEGYKAGMEQAAAMAKEAQTEKDRERDELAGTLEAERKEWVFKLEQMRADLEAAEEREARRAKELAELKREKAQAGMDAARGIRADALTGLDLGAAVRTFIGAAGTLPQMGRQLADMGEDERGAILAQVDTVARWVEGARTALGVVKADASIM